MPDCTHLEFVHTPEFVDSVEDLLTALVPGTGGVRKLRFALPGGGKSGGARVLYVYTRSDCRVYFLLAYSKHVRETLGQGEKNALKKWVQTL